MWMCVSQNSDSNETGNKNIKTFNTVFLSRLEIFNGYVFKNISSKMISLIPKKLT